MCRHLVTTIRVRFPDYLTGAFEIGEISKKIIPYRYFRRNLGVDTNSHYEELVMHLVAGERGYLVADDDVRTALQRELRSANPDEAVVKRFAERRVTLSHTARALESITPVSTPTTPSAPAMPAAPTMSATPAASSPATSSSPTPAMPPSPAVPPSKAPKPDVPQRHSPAPPVRSTTASEVGGSCRYCGGTLPDGRRLTFCPHCGQDLTIQQCPACGTELEIGWKFCTTCGRSVSGA